MTTASTILRDMRRQHRLNGDRDFEHTVLRDRLRIAELEAGVRLIAEEDCQWCRRALPLVNDGIYRDTIWHRYGGELVGCRASRLLIATGVRIEKPEN